MKMACIQQEIQDLKVQLDVEGRQKHSSKDQKTMKRIEALKEQFRELLVESRQRKAAESENAMILTEDENVGPFNKYFG
jgi:rRNA-processing protein FCF1